MACLLCLGIRGAWLLSLSAGLKQGVLRLHELLMADAQVLVELVITKDNGEIETFNAYRVQHSNSRGPYKGGLRYHPQVDLDDVRRHAHLSDPA